MATNQQQAGTRYCEMTRKSASRGSLKFVFQHAHDERTYLPSWRGKQSDNPIANFRGFTKFRWLAMDVRMFGFKEAFKKTWYMYNCWYSRTERIYMGMDENGNKYWQSWDGQRQGGGRWFEPADPHWHRGWDSHTPSPAWQMWLGNMIAHTPATIKARGEWGPNGRAAKTMAPFNVRWRPDIYSALGRDPTHVPNHTVFFSPWSNIIKEAGYARYVYNRNPMWVPMLQPHDLKQEIVEDFFRRDLLSLRKMYYSFFFNTPRRPVTTLFQS